MTEKKPKQPESKKRSTPKKVTAITTQEPAEKGKSNAVKVKTGKSLIKEMAVDSPINKTKKTLKKTSATETITSPPEGNVYPHSRFTDFDIQLFQSGKHYRLYEKMGAHGCTLHGKEGTYFAVWAPNAAEVNVMGNFNFWNRYEHKLNLRWDGSGIWDGFIPDVKRGEAYKYAVITPEGHVLEKGDPYAYYWELRPNTASIVWDTYYEWQDNAWMKKRKKNNALNAPVSVYEVHLGSWKRNAHNPEEFLSYRELAALLPQYCKELGFTHVELMPVMEHPFDGSWGYQQTGYFAATSRFGTPQDFMFLLDTLHQHEIGVLLDWVPSHFPYDMHGLHMFDGTHLYEHADMRKGYHPDWKSYIFNSGRNEVRSFLISNALFWFDRYHADGLRVDAVASMLYLDYSRKEGEWIPNELGGRENLENVALLKALNETVYKEFPDVQMIAEESTSWPGVSKPLYNGGLGFGMKWMMGWMNDTLTYFKRDPMYRSWHQNDLTFSMVYAYSENFMLPLSHDEVVHGKASLLNKMPGDEWQKFANLRLLYMYMWTHPGSKLLFMGGEFGQWTEWNFKQGLEWHVLDFPQHKGVQHLIQDLNHLYRNEASMHQHQFDPKGFEWIAADDHKNAVLSFIRKGEKAHEFVVVVLNFTPNVLHEYRIGVPEKGTYTEILNSDNARYWGSDVQNSEVKSDAVAQHGKLHSIAITLPPLGGAVFKIKGKKSRKS